MRGAHGAIVSRCRLAPSALRPRSVCRRLFLPFSVRPVDVFACGFLYVCGTGSTPSWPRSRLLYLLRRDPLFCEVCSRVRPCPNAPYGTVHARRCVECTASTLISIAVRTRAQTSQNFGLRNGELGATQGLAAHQAAGERPLLLGRINPSTCQRSQACQPPLARHASCCFMLLVRCRSSRSSH